MKSNNILSKLFTVVVSLIAIVNIVCGFFWAKGFYFLGPFLAWGGIISLFFLFGGKVLENIKRAGGLKRMLRDLLDDDECVSPKPAKKEVKKEKEETIPSKEKVLSRAEYEKKANALIEDYGKALQDSDSVLMEEIRAELDALKKKEPPKVEIDLKKEQDDLRKIMGV